MSLSSPAKFKLEPVIYDLTPVNSYLALETIHQYSRALVDQDYMNYITNSLLYRHQCQRPTIFGFINGPINLNIAQRVIGADGFYLKLTNNVTGVDYIWFDRKANMFLVWGSNKFKVVKALNSLRWRIHKYSIISEETDKESITDYSDMPDLISCNGDDDGEAATTSEQV
jgi:hypothetical protein